MQKIFLIISLLFFFTHCIHAQPVVEKLDAATKKFETDAQMKGAIYSIYVVNANTGEVVYDVNSNIGLATASCLKVLTSCTALDVLGAEYTFKTECIAKGNVVKIMGSGDPTLGSKRYPEASADVFINKCIANLKLNKLQPLQLFVDDKRLGTDRISGGTIWEDIGNYYGSTCSAFNWHENQTDAVFKTGAKGTLTSFLRTDPVCSDLQFENETISGDAGSGDNSVSYYIPNSTKRLIKGTLGGKNNIISTSVSVPDPVTYFGDALHNYFPQVIKLQAAPNFNKSDSIVSFTHSSPALSSIVYWFNKKSINLYGDALMRTVGYVLNKDGDYYKAANTIKNYWVKKNIGIEPYDIKIYDGSGLSPLTKVTTKALVNIMQYAYKAPWYNSFYESLPLYNNMKLKSGTINNVKGFTGIHTNKDGITFLVSMLVNNYNGATSSMVAKMFKVLDALK